MIALPKFMALGFLSLGIFLLMQVVLPVVSFQVWELGQKYKNPSLISPKKVSSQVLGVSIENRNNFPAIVSSLNRETVPTYKEFSLTVPKLKIDKTAVLVDSNDLSSGLTHLPGSALPGERGNVFISGHSALSPIFSLKTASFAKLQDLKKGDEIIVFAGGAKFSYEVTEFKVVKPEDLSVIYPPEEQGRYITLMTCVPPGLNLKRLIVLGKMI